MSQQQASVPVRPLRRRMLDDMAMRGLHEDTQRNYMPPRPPLQARVTSQGDRFRGDLPQLMGRRTSLIPAWCLHRHRARNGGRRLPRRGTIQINARNAGWDRRAKLSLLVGRPTTGDPANPEQGQVWMSETTTLESTTLGSLARMPTTTIAGARSASLADREFREPMAYGNREHKKPVLALNAARLATPGVPLPAAIVPYDRDALHAYLDREEQDVFAVRHGDGMVVVPLTPDAALPGEREGLRPADNLRLVSTLAREAVFRLLLLNADKGYRVIRRRPPTVVAVKPENIVPEDLGLPDWLRRRLVLEFETRIIEPRKGHPFVVLTCSKRLRTSIDLDCGRLRDLGVPLLGAAVSSFEANLDPKVQGRLRFAGQVVDVRDGTVLLTDQGDGPAEVPIQGLSLEPTRANFRRVVETLTQGKAERVLQGVEAAEADWHAGEKTLDTLHAALGWVGRVGVEIADGVPLRFEGKLDQGDGGQFPKAHVIWKPKLSFDPGGVPDTRVSWAQKGLDSVGPYDRHSFTAKRPRIAVLCEAGERAPTEAMVDHLLHGLPEIQTQGLNPLKPHGTGLLGRFRLGEPDVRFFDAVDGSGASYLDAARRALGNASARDETWDLALVQVRRAWRERAYDDSPYWGAKAAFLKRGTPVQAISLDLEPLEDIGYASAMANMSLAIYAKLGGVPWLLPSRTSTDHELVFGLGSHTVRQGRRGPGERVVGIATLFSGQGHFFLDSRTAAVPFGEYPTALRATIVDAVSRIRAEENWLADDSVRLVFHAFTQMGRETVDAVSSAVAELGLRRARHAFLHVVEDHPFTAFDRSSPVGRGAYAPQRGQVVELSEREWLLTLTGGGQVKGDRQGLPDPVLLRLHEQSTHRAMDVLAAQVSDFAMHSWRTFGPARLPITLGYANEVARQLAGLERTPNWDPDAMEGRVMRRPWFL